MPPLNPAQGLIDPAVQTTPPLRRGKPTRQFSVSILVATALCSMLVGIALAILVSKSLDPESTAKPNKKATKPSNAVVDEGQSNRLAEREKQLRLLETALREREQKLVLREREIASQGDRNKQPAVAKSEEDRPSEENPDQLFGSIAGPRPISKLANAKKVPPQNEGNDVARDEITIDEQLRLLEGDPDPDTRSGAALTLAQYSAHAERIVPPMVRALEREVSDDSKSAILQAITLLGPSAIDASPALVRVVNNTKTDVHRRLAFDALLAIDSNSAHVRTILTTALLGGRGPRPVPHEPNSLIDSNREFACNVLHDLGSNAKWAIPLLADVARSIVRSEYRDDELVRQFVRTLMAINQDDARVLECLKQLQTALATDRNSPRDGFGGYRRDASELRVEIDSAIKEIQSHRAKSKDKEKNED
jgi:hypothetical protein